LSSLINSVKRIVRGNRYLKPSHLALSQAGETVEAPIDDVLLKQRITDVKNALQIEVICFCFKVNDQVHIFFYFSI
jgi:hypothetical protein